MNNGNVSPMAIPADASDGATTVSAITTESLERGTRLLLVARVCFFACSYAATALLARKLGAASFGIYGVIISILLWIEMIANAGIPAATSKLMAGGRHSAAEVESSARALLLVASILLLAVCWVAAPAVAGMMGIPNGHSLLRLALLDLPFAGIYASYEGVLNGYRRFGTVALMHITYGLAKLGGVLALLGLGFSIERVLIANVVASAGVCAGLLFLYPPRLFRLGPTVLTRLVAIAGPMALYLISGQVLLSLDLWLLKSLWRGGGEVVGQYVASVNVARTLMLIPAVQAGVVFASVAWAVASHDVTRALPHVREAIRFAIIVVGASCIILGFHASAVLTVLFSAEYADGYRFLRLQLAAFGLFALVDVFANSLQAAGARWRVAAALVPMIPLVALITAGLILQVGPMGAAIGMLLGMCASALISGVIVYRRFGSPIPWVTVLRVLIASAVVAVVSAVTPTSQLGAPVLLAKLAGLGGLYLLVLFALREITAKDFGFRGMVDRSPER